MQAASESAHVAAGSLLRDHALARSASQFALGVAEALGGDTGITRGESQAEVLHRSPHASADVAIADPAILRLTVSFDGGLVVGHRAISARESREAPESSRLEPSCRPRPRGKGRGLRWQERGLGFSPGLGKPIEGQRAIKRPTASGGPERGVGPRRIQ